MREGVHAERISFKKVLNNAVRVALGAKLDADRPEFRVEARKMGLRRGVDPASFHDLEADLEAKAFADSTRKLESTLRK